MRVKAKQETRASTKAGAQLIATVNEERKGERSARLNSGGAAVVARLGGAARICAICEAGSMSECALRDACGRDKFLGHEGGR